MRIRLGGCPGLSESLLGAHSLCWFCHVAAEMIYIQVKWLGYASKQIGCGCNQRSKQERHSICYKASISSVHILNTHLALFQPPEIREEDSKLNHIAWISSLDIRKCKRLIIKEFDLFENQCWNMDKSSNFKHWIVISAISIRKTMCRGPGQSWAK